MEFSFQLFLDILKVMIPLFIFMWAGLWFLVRTLVFNPLQNMANEIKALRQDLIEGTHNLDKRVTVVEAKVVLLEARRNHP